MSEILHGASRVSVRTERECPFCGTTVRLGDLPIVATNVVRKTGDGGKSEVMPRSGSPVRGRVGTWPVVADAPLANSSASVRQRIARVVNAELPALTDMAKTADIPARVCLNCKTPLPENLDDRPVYIIAVVGTTGAGKSHYLASVLEAAVKRQALRNIGFEEFSFDEVSGPTFTQRYFVPVFRNRSQLDHTQGDPEVVRKPLVCRMKHRDSGPALLMFHDVAGEYITDRSRRALESSFLRRADALIFLVDPLSLDRPDGASWPEDTLYADQAHLINACLSEMAPHRRASTPIAVTLSKADLFASELTTLAGVEIATRPDVKSVEQWNRALHQTDRAVRDLLGLCRAHDVLAAAELAPNPMVSYHAVSALGCSPDDETGRIPRVQPHGCLDPLVAVLYRIPGFMGGR